MFALESFHIPTQTRQWLAWETNSDRAIQRGRKFLDDMGERRGEFIIKVEWRQYG